MMVEDETAQNCCDEARRTYSVLCASGSDNLAPATRTAAANRRPHILFCRANSTATVGAIVQFCMPHCGQPRV